MTPSERQQLDQWLEAEGAGLTDRADEVLTALFRSVPRREPRPGFADRVLRSVAAQAHARSWAWSQWWLKGAVALTLLLCGLATAFLPVASLSAVAMDWSAHTAQLVVEASVRTISWLHLGVAAWRVVDGLARAAALVLTTPAAVAVLAANVALAIALAGALKRLLSSGEEWSQC